MKRVRWACPRVEDHSAVLGPQRPRKDNLCRYCVPCSVETGKLQERIAPTVERQREASRQRSSTKAQRKRERERAKLEARWVIGGVDMRREIERLKKLVARRYQWPGIASAAVGWTRRSDGMTSGRAWAWQHRIHISAGSDASDVRECILHELLHLVSRRKGWGDDRCSSHSLRFRDELTAAACDAFGLTLEQIATAQRGSSTRHRYTIDWAIRAAMRAKETR